MMELSHKRIKQSVQAFQNYSKGGHIEADKKVIAVAKEQAAVATDEEALEKLRIADEEIAAALFGDNPTASPPKISPKSTSPTKGSPKKPGKAEILDSSPGKRHRWQETFIYGGNGEQFKKEPEVSLLDLD